MRPFVYATTCALVLALAGGAGCDEAVPADDTSDTAAVGDSAEEAAPDAVDADDGADPTGDGESDIDAAGDSTASTDTDDSGDAPTDTDPADVEDRGDAGDAPVDPDTDTDGSGDAVDDAPPDAIDTSDSDGDADAVDGSDAGPTVCTTGEECGTDEYCDQASCGAPGECTARPTLCPRVILTVCGCDGVTYLNECEAAAAGTSVAHSEACTTDGCTSNDECAATEYCRFLAGCTAPGTCTDRPVICPDVFAPVCGCDGRTYSNSCDAAAAGQNVDTSRTCDGRE